MVTPPDHALQAALDARTYDDGLKDGQFQELSHLHLHLMDLSRALGQAIWDVETRMTALRGKP